MSNNRRLTSTGLLRPNTDRPRKRRPRLKELILGLRYVLYVVLPYASMQLIPQLFVSSHAVNEVEKAMVLLLVFGGLAPLTYVPINNLVWNKSEAWKLTSSQGINLATGIAILSTRPSVELIGGLTGLGIAVFLNNVLVRFDSLRFQEEKRFRYQLRSPQRENLGKETLYEEVSPTPNISRFYRLSKHGIVHQELTLYGQIPILQLVREKLQHLAGVLNSFGLSIVERHNGITIIYLRNRKCWFFQRKIVTKELINEFERFFAIIDPMIIAK